MDVQLCYFIHMKQNSCDCTPLLVSVFWGEILSSGSYSFEIIYISFPRVIFHINSIVAKGEKKGEEIYCTHVINIYI